jgi:hypothetical protein
MLGERFSDIGIRVVGGQNKITRLQQGTSSPGETGTDDHPRLDLLNRPIELPDADSANSNESERNFLPSKKASRKADWRFVPPNPSLHDPSFLGQGENQDHHALSSAP